MSFDTNWDIDKYKEDHESDDHWMLRRNFMEKWQNSYPEERLVCLGRAFTNIEFMGCRYPQEVMQEVARMSKEVNNHVTYNHDEKFAHNFGIKQLVNQDSTAERMWYRNAAEATHGTLNISQPDTKDGYDIGSSNQVSKVNREYVWGQYSSEVMQGPVSISKVLQTPYSKSFIRENSLNQNFGNANDSIRQRYDQNSVQQSSGLPNFVNETQSSVDGQNPGYNFASGNLSWRRNDPRLGFANTSTAQLSLAASSAGKVFDESSTPVDDRRFVLYPKENTYYVKFYNGERIAKEVVKLNYRKSLKKRIAIYTVGKKGGTCRKALPESKKKHIRWWMDQGMNIEEALLLSLRPYQEIYEETLQGKHSYGTRISINNLLEQIKITGNLNRSQVDDSMSSDISDVDEIEISQQDEVQSPKDQTVQNALHLKPIINQDINFSENTKILNMSPLQDQNMGENYGEKSTHVPNNYWSQDALKDRLSNLPSICSQQEPELTTQNQKTFENPFSSKSLSVPENTAKAITRKIACQDAGAHFVSRRGKKVKLTQAGKRRLHFWLHVGKTPKEARILSQSRLSKYPEYKEYKQMYGSCRKFTKKYNRRVNVLKLQHEASRQLISDYLAKKSDVAFKDHAKNTTNSTFHAQNTDLSDVSSKEKVLKKQSQDIYIMPKDINITTGETVDNTGKAMINITTTKNYGAATAIAGNIDAVTAAVSNAGVSNSKSVKTAKNILCSDKLSGPAKERFNMWINLGKTHKEAMILCQKPLKDIPLFNEMMANPDLANKSNYLRKMAEKELSKNITKIPPKINTINLLQPNNNSTNIDPVTIEISDDEIDGSLSTRRHEELENSMNIKCSDANQTDGNDSWLKIYIKDPNRVIHRTEILALRNAIKECIGDNKEISMPIFMIRVGCAVLKCVDEQSRDWLDKEIPTLLPWEGAQLKIISENDIPIFHNTWIYVPIVPESGPTCLEPGDLLEKLHQQNPGVGCGNWKILSTKVQKEGQLSLVRIDEKSAHVLKSRGNKLKWYSSRPIKIKAKCKLNIKNEKLEKCKLNIKNKKLDKAPIYTAAKSTPVITITKQDSNHMAKESAAGSSYVDTVQTAIPKTPGLVINTEKALTFETSCHPKMLSLGCNVYGIQTVPIPIPAIPQKFPRIEDSKTADSRIENICDFWGIDTPRLIPGHKAAITRKPDLRRSSQREDSYDVRCNENSFREIKTFDGREDQFSLEERVFAARKQKYGQNKVAHEQSCSRDKRVIHEEQEYSREDRVIAQREQRHALEESTFTEPEQIYSKVGLLTPSLKLATDSYEPTYLQEGKGVDEQGQGYLREDKVLDQCDGEYYSEDRADVQVSTEPDESYSCHDRVLAGRELEYSRGERVFVEHEQESSRRVLAGRQDEYSREYGALSERNEEYSQKGQISAARDQEYPREGRIFVEEDQVYPRQVGVLAGQNEEYSWESRVSGVRDQEYPREDRFVAEQHQVYFRQVGVLAGQNEEYSRERRVSAVRDQEYPREDNFFAEKDQGYSRKIGVLAGQSEEYTRESRILAVRDQEYSLEDRVSAELREEYYQEDRVLDGQEEEYSRANRALPGRDVEYSREGRASAARDQEYSRGDRVFAEKKCEDQGYSRQDRLLSGLDEEYSQRNRALSGQNEDYSQEERGFERRDHGYGSSREDIVFDERDEEIFLEDKDSVGRGEEYHWKDTVFNSEDHGNRSSRKDRVFDEQDQAYSREDKVVTIREQIYYREARILSRPDQEYFPKDSGFGKRDKSPRKNNVFDIRNPGYSQQNNVFAGRDKYPRKDTVVNVREQTYSQKNECFANRDQKYSRENRVFAKTCDEYFPEDRKYYNRNDRARGSRLAESCIFVEDRVSTRPETGSDTRRSNDGAMGWHSQGSKRSTESNKKTKKKNKRKRGLQDDF